MGAARQLLTQATMWSSDDVPRTPDVMEIICGPITLDVDTNEHPDVRAIALNGSLECMPRTQEALEGSVTDGGAAIIVASRTVARFNGPAVVRVPAGCQAVMSYYRMASEDFAFPAASADAIAAYCRTGRTRLPGVSAAAHLEHAAGSARVLRTLHLFSGPLRPGDLAHELDLAAAAKGWSR